MHGHILCPSLMLKGGFPVSTRIVSGALVYLIHEPVCQDMEMEEELLGRCSIGVLPKAHHAQQTPRYAMSVQCIKLQASGVVEMTSVMSYHSSTMDEL